MPEKYYRPDWVQPAFMETQGYKLVEDKDGYMRYHSKWPLAQRFSTVGPGGRRILNSDERVIYINTTYAPDQNMVFVQIREDGNTRTSYNGVVADKDFFQSLLMLTQ